jgi:hypothetical protein
MRRTAFVFLIAALGLGSLTGGPMSKDDRQRVIAHLQMTESWLADEVSGLSPAQLNYRYAPFWMSSNIWPSPSRNTGRTCRRKCSSRRRNPKGR